MLSPAFGCRRLVFGTACAIMLPIVTQTAEARSLYRHHHYSVFRVGYFSRHFPRGRHHYARAHHVIQCVAFARRESGVELRGNAVAWWNEASGLYARGKTPEEGAILSFRGTRHMRLGHVAVVRRIAGDREIEIDHAHWASRGIRRSVSVIDVSPDNDWTAVRVELARGGSYGSVYPTNGFIYDRAPEARIETATTTTDPTPQVQAAMALELVDQAVSDPPEEQAPVWRVRRHSHRRVTHRRFHREFAQFRAGHGWFLWARGLGSP